MLSVNDAVSTLIFTESNVRTFTIYKDRADAVKDIGPADYGMHTVFVYTKRQLGGVACCEILRH